MQLSVKMLNSSSSLNSLMYQNQTFVSSGETKTIYFQLIDLDMSNGNCSQRFIPTSAATVSVNFISLDIAKNISKIASNPFADDRSIWAITLNSSETASLAGVNMNVTVVDGSNIYKTVASSVLVVNPKSPYSC